MRFRTLDINWDWNFGNGKNSYSSDSLALAYNLKTRLLSWYGDCFFALTEGIDWVNVLGSKISKKDVDAKVLQTINISDGVLETSYFNSSIVNRKYTCTARVKTIYGDTIEVKI